MHIQICSQFYFTGVCCSCTTVRTKIIQQYDQLTNLPIDNLLPQLVAKGVIDINDKQAIDNETKNSKKMMYLLDNVIISSLALGFPQKYNWFVAALNENDDLIARELSGRLRKFFLNRKYQGVGNDLEFYRPPLNNF